MPTSLLASGVPLAPWSDDGGDEATPYLNIMLANTRAASPGEALSREQALLALAASDDPAVSRWRRDASLFDGAGSARSQHAARAWERLQAGA